MTHRLYLALVVLLPLHTLYLSAWISWKPWLVLLLIVAILDLWGTRGVPWGRAGALAFGLFAGTVLVSWPGPDTPITFWRLVLAVGAGGLLLMVTGHHARDLDGVLRAVFWSGAAMAALGFVIGLVTNGTFGAEAVAAVNDLPGINRVNKPAYVVGFVAVTNWHQDPGYAALWSNAWFVLSGHAWLRGAVRAPRWVGPAVLGGLATLTVLTLSRTGWFGLGLAVVALFLSVRSDRRGAVRLLGLATVAAGLMLAALFVTDPASVGNDMADSVGFRLANLVVLGEIEVGDDEVVPGLDPGDNRLEVWTVYWARFLGSPLRGTGLGTGWAETDFQEPHNLWLQLIAETGLIGLVGFITMVGLIARAAGRPAPPIAAAMSVVGLATLTQTVLFEPVLWFILGCWYAASRARVHLDDVGAPAAGSDRR